MNDARQLDRRQALRELSLGAAGIAAYECFGTPGTAAKAPPVLTQTFIYKTYGDLEIRADLRRPDDTKQRPVLFWIHGGALILGNRNGITREVREAFLQAGYAIVSIDYRLAP